MPLVEVVSPCWCTMLIDWERRRGGGGGCDIDINHRWREAGGPAASLVYSLLNIKYVLPFQI